MQPPFTLPLDRPAFEKALRNGHGRALLHVREHGATGFEDLILRACREIWIVDTQLYWTGRSAWLFDIARDAGVADALAAELQERLAGDTSEKGESLHRSLELAAEFTRWGARDFRTSLRAIFIQHLERGDVVGGDDIVWAEGEEGFRFVAESIAEWLPPYDTGHADVLLDSDWILFIYEYDDEFVDDAARKYLEDWAPSNPAIGRLLEFWDDYDEAEEEVRLSRPRLVERDASAAEVIESVRDADDDHDMSIFLWARKASRVDRSEIVDALRNETARDVVVQLLRCLARLGPPAFEPFLLDFADSEDPDIRRAANIALGNLDHPAVLELARRRLDDQDLDHSALRLFKASARPEDLRFILDRYEPTSDVDERFYNLGALEDVLSAHPEFLETEREAFLELAVLIYEKAPTPRPRTKILALLIKSNAAPQWMLEECEADAAHYVQYSLRHHEKEES